MRSLPAGGADLRSPPLNSIRESGTDQLTEGLAKDDFGYLQSISLKDENHLWATICKLKKEEAECFAANAERIFLTTCGSASLADTPLLRLLLQLALRMQLQRWHQHCHPLQRQEPRTISNSWNITLEAAMRRSCGLRLRLKT